MSTRTWIPEAGFAEQAHDAQQTFRALLEALARPTRPQPVRASVGVPEPLTPAAAATLLTLCDEATAVWIDPVLGAAHPGVEAWLRFHAGSPVIDDPGRADFAVVAAPGTLPDLDTFAVGTDEAPHTSCTVVVVDARSTAPGGSDRSHALPSGIGGRRFRADGPGLEHPVDWAAPAFPVWFADQWRANGARFPRGVDLVVAGHDTVTGLPRTTRLTEVD